jgi:uncharacterized membrane protein YjgN (DUF898 family)
MTEPTVAVREGSPTVAPLRFNGTTADYFRIWIVNMALTVVTLGIYSAWAKVRKLRYFYGNTHLEGTTFDYHAKPEAILFGRLIAVAILGLYWALSYYLPIGALVLLAIIGLLIPFVVVRAHMFQLRNSSYRQIRFGFEPNYKGACKAYYGGVLVTILTLGLGAPYALYMRYRFAVDNSRFGREAFHFKGEAGRFFAIIYAGIGLTIVGFVGYILLVMTFGGPSDDPGGAASGPAQLTTLDQLVTTVPIFLLYLAIGVYTMVRIRNYVWSNTELKANSFTSSLSVRTMCWLYLSNVVAIICTVGLAVPWAQIRLARYRAECTQAILGSGWQEFVAAERQQASALGEEIGEAFDVSVDLAI